MFLAQKFLSGVINVVSNNIDQFVPTDPPPPRRPAVYAEQHESNEEKQFRRVFQQLAGDDMEVSPKELMDILNRIVTKHGDLKTGWFQHWSLVEAWWAVMDSDSTGKLGFHEFKQLWDNIKKWQGVYKTYDADCSGLIGADELPNAFRAAGFPLNDELFSMIIRRYSDECGNMDFDNYIGCLVRLDSMCRAFKTLDKDHNGTIKVNVQEWLQLTMYS
uniref:Calpain, small subunit 1 a n=1 Tax=Gasterosteus aculeatus aculeatus TaxID=481459 RepID=G3Q9T3_GASAC|nr:calpain small subunit 1-like [Gasterosteus aculeatus aculeatus]